jgi:hypothetical protein
MQCVDGQWYGHMARAAKIAGRGNSRKTALLQDSITSHKNTT